MKKLKLKKITKYIQYKRRNQEGVFNFIHNNESDFVSHLVEPEGDMILETKRYGFRVKENHWLIIIDKKLYRLENDLFNLLFIKRDAKSES